jgi:hypothetical protein
VNEFLSSFSNRSSGQKILIVVGGCVIVLLLIIASYFLSSPSQNKSQLPAQTVQPSVVPVQTIQKILPMGITGNVASYTNSWYSINYPNAFSYQENPLSGGGISLTLKHINPDPSNMVIIIQTYDPSVSSQSAIENFFSALNYQKSQITISNVPGVEYKGSLSVGGTSLRDDAVIFTYYNWVYKLQLTYAGSTENNAAEQVFQGVVKSFKLVPGD